MNTPLRRARAKRGLTLKQVAEAVNYDAGNLSRVETGQQGASLKMVQKLAKFFSLSPLDILFPKQQSPNKVISAPRTARTRRSDQERQA